MNTYKIIKEYVVEADSEEQAEWAVIRGEVAAKVTVIPTYAKYVENEYTPFFRKVIKKYFETLEKNEVTTITVDRLMREINVKIEKHNDKAYHTMWSEDINLPIYEPSETELIGRFTDYCVNNPDGMVASWRDDVVDIGK